MNIAYSYISTVIYFVFFSSIERPVHIAKTEYYLVSLKYSNGSLRGSSSALRINT